MIKASKFEYKGEFRIKVEMPYNEENIRKVKKVRDARWSFTLKTWHIPYDKESFEILKSLFPDIVYPQREKEENHKEESKFNNSEIQINVTGRKILICMRKNSSDIDFIKSLKYSRWNNNTFQWEVSNWGDNLQKIQEHFGTRVTSFKVEDYKKIDKTHQTFEVSNDEITIIQTSKGRLKLIFRYDKVLTEKIKTFRYKSWDETNKWWTLPYSEFNLKEILRYARERNKKINFEKEELVKTIQPRIPKEDVPNYRECPLAYKQKLIEKRYSTNTQKTYISHFEEFINFYYRLDINSINEPQIQAFMMYLNTERMVSDSYLNLSVNAIKFYYEKVLGGARKFYFLDRPKKEQRLPVVLSKEEMKRIIEVTENIKHKSIILLLYSSGLRVSEIINLKIAELDWDRMLIKVNLAKGKKDRYAKLAHSFKKIFMDYMEAYHPRVYLFEGWHESEYSAGSIRNILKEAAKKAGIEKNVTPHVLRHTYATHSMDEGADLRYLQETLGHNSIKTTEIYTHITKKSFDQHKSPLDTLDF